jgi:hypothetical protein
MHVLKQQTLYCYIKIVVKRVAENRTFSRIWTSRKQDEQVSFMQHSECAYAEANILYSTGGLHRMYVSSVAGDIT